MNKEKKTELAPKIKEVLKKYGLKGTLSIDNHSTLVLTIQSGKILFENDRVNEYWIDEQRSGIAKDCIIELRDAMKIGNWNNSDPMTDYFDVGWYITIQLGKRNKPYVYTGE